MPASAIRRCIAALLISNGIRTGTFILKTTFCSRELLSSREAPLNRSGDRKMQAARLTSPAQEAVLREKALQRLVTAFICTGLAFLVLPGTFLGVWNLISISKIGRASCRE